MSSPDTLSPTNDSCANCCCDSKENVIEAAPQNAKTIENICKIAIGVFAAYMAPVSFCVAFGIGVGVGISYALYGRAKSGNDSRPACAQGFMEYLSGTKFQPEIVQAVTGIFIAQHVHHAPNFYVPFCGVFLGFWAFSQLINKEVPQAHSNVVTV